MGFLESFNEMFTLYIVFPAVVLLGLYFTIRLRCVQLSKLKMSFKELFKKSGNEEGNISHFQAVASVLASNFGTGNISGMAVALTMGGPGALIWMWVMVFLGAAIQFANCLLGVKYRKKDSRGEYVGGPMYYLKNGLGLKKMAILFSIFVIFAAVAVGDFVQVNSIALPFAKMGISPWITGAVIAFFVAIVVFGGAERVAQVSAGVVPIMALFYLGAACVILGISYDKILPALGVIWDSALGATSIVGGTAGYAVMKGLTTGFDRAIFATDAGTGTIPILQSGAKTRHPVIDGVVTLVAPFLVMIVCSVTALVLIVTGAWGGSDLQSTNMVTYAFSHGLNGEIGTYIVLLALLLFGYTTTLAWATCLERAVGFLFGHRFVRYFLILYILLIPVGAVLHVSMVWLLADIALTMMLVLNLIGVTGLSKEVIDDTHAFFHKPLETTAETVNPE